MGSILIENGNIVTLNDQFHVFSPGFLLIEDDRILDIGSGNSPSKHKKADTVINAHNMAVMPGMVNAHTHLFQTFLRGLADDKPLLDWLKTAIWPIAQEMKEEDAYTAALLGILENLRGGATSIIDHQYIHADRHNDDGVCRAAQETGVRFMLARGWADRDYHPSLMETPDRIINETKRLWETWQGKNNGCISVEFAPLIPWGCSDDLMHQTHQISQAWGSGMHIHVAETQDEIDMNLDLRGNRHIEWLDDLGMLSPSTQLVHSVWLTDQEIDLIAQHQAVVVHCPVSNMYLASGVAQVPKMLQKGIAVALATDGPGSNNNQDMFAVLKTTALLHKVNTLNAMALLPEDVLKMACRGGAAAIGMSDQLGTLQPGKKADVILVDLNTPFAMPVHKIPSALVYNLGVRDVDTVIVNGNILMRGKQFCFIDEQAILAKAREVCQKLFKRAGVDLN